MQARCDKEGYVPCQKGNLDGFCVPKGRYNQCPINQVLSAEDEKTVSWPRFGKNLFFAENYSKPITDLKFVSKPSRDYIEIKGNYSLTQRQLNEINGVLDITENQAVQRKSLQQKKNDEDKSFKFYYYQTEMF